MSFHPSFKAVLVDLQDIHEVKRAEYGNNNQLLAFATGREPWEYQAERALEMVARLWRLKDPARISNQLLEAAHALCLAESLRRE